MPKLGQHFLKNQKALIEIARALELGDGDIVIEVGPGHGELTEKLKVESSKLKVSQIVAIEKDKLFAELLRKKFAEDTEVQIVEGDVLKELPRITKTFNVEHGTWKLVGNIPYYLTGKLLRTVGELEHKPSVCVFTIQKEVAERLVAAPPRMNRLAASVAFWARPAITMRLPRGDFNPPPDVDSAVIKLTVRTSSGLTRGSREEVLDPRFHGDDRNNEENYYRAVRALFSQPRKTILNNLMTGRLETKGLMTKELKKIGIRADARPQDLSTEDIARIAEII